MEAYDSIFRTTMEGETVAAIYAKLSNASYYFGNDVIVSDMCPYDGGGVLLARV